MKLASRSKKVAFISGIAVLAIAVGATVYATLSNSTDDSLFGALNSAINPAKAKASQMTAITTAEMQTTQYISPSRIAVTSDGKFAFVNDETAQKVYKIDLTTNQKVKETPAIGELVNNVVVNGNDVYVLYGELDGKVAKYTTELTQVGTPVSVGHTPSAGVVNGTELYVANRFNNNVMVINTATMAVTNTINVSREPISVAIAKGNLYVACHLQDGPANAKKVAAKVSVINLSTKAVSNIQLTNGSEGVKDICASPDGNYVYVTHILARYGYPTTQLDRGWINTNAVSIINATTSQLWNTVLLDQVDLGAGNPWGIRATADKLIVAISGTQETIVIDRSKMHEKITKVDTGVKVIDTLRSSAQIPDYVNFLDGTRTRISIPGQNPRGVAVVNNKAYFANYISGDVTVLDLSNNAKSSISLGTQAAPDSVRHGEALWYDATYCYQKWESCASCHPDARMDSINWDNLNDGLGNPKSAKSMLYSHRTPPTMVTGIRASAEIAVRAGMKYIQFNTISEQDNVAIDDFLKSLKPVQSPYLQKNGTLTADAQAGEALFQQNCASCHTGPFFTDLEKHQSGIAYPENWETKANTPYVTSKLVEVWRTGPWGVSGNFATINDYIKASDSANQLNETQVNQLAKYVLSIGNENEYYGLEQVQVTDKGALTANKLIPGSRIDKITYRRQLNTNTDAIATFELFDATGKSLKKVTKELSHTMSDRISASVDVNFDVPANLAKNSYFKVTITDKSDATKKLATDFEAKYKG